MTKKKSNPETIIMRSVINALKMLPGAMVWRNNVGAMRAPGGAFVRFGEAGASDIFMVYGGCFYAIEVKAPDGQMSAAQYAWRSRLLSAGGDYVVITSTAEAMRFVNCLKNRA